MATQTNYLFCSWLRASAEEFVGGPWEPLVDILRQSDDASTGVLAGDVVARFRAVAHRVLEEWACPHGGYAEAEVAATKRLSVAANSRWFVVDGLVRWVFPPEDGRVKDPRAAPCLLSLGSSWDILRPLVQHVSITGRDDAFAALRERIEKFVTEELGHFSGGVHMTFSDNPHGDLWLDADGDTVYVKEEIKEICARLSDRVNAITPAFISNKYQVKIVPLRPDLRGTFGGRRVAVRLMPHSGTEDFDLVVAASGIAAWTAYCIFESIRVAEDETPSRHRHLPDTDHVSPPVTLYVLDEPERHLHPLAQEEAAEWVAARAQRGAHLLLATHAVPFLRLPMSDVEYLRVCREDDWSTTVSLITGDILGSVHEAAELMGLPPVALIQLTRAWLVVEGEHDRLILDAYFGSELRRAGVQLLPLRGAARAKASFLNLAALAPLHIPFFCLLDNVGADAVRNGVSKEKRQSEEERIYHTLHRLNEGGGVPVTPVGLPYPDIICALPMDAIRTLARDHGGRPDAASSWDGLLASYRALPERRDFKGFVLRTIGLRDWSADRLVKEVLDLTRGEVPQDCPLHPIIMGILSRVPPVLTGPG